MACTFARPSPPPPPPFARTYKVNGPISLFCHNIPLSFCENKIFSYLSFSRNDIHFSCSQVAYIANLIDPLADAVVGFASKLTGGAEKQTEILDNAKTVAESASQLIYSAKDAGGNSKVKIFD